MSFLADAKYALFLNGLISITGIDRCLIVLSVLQLFYLSRYILYSCLNSFEILLDNYFHYFYNNSKSSGCQIIGRFSNQGSFYDYIVIIAYHGNSI